MTKAKDKAIVLLSGGQDSTTCLYWALGAGWDVTAVSIWYGQRHAAELSAAREIAKLAGVEHVEIGFPDFGSIGGSPLTGAGEILGEGGIPDATMPQGLPTSFVPGRNALFFSVAASVAVARGAKVIVSGVCQTDFSGYPDCRREFVDAMEAALSLAMPSSSGPIEILTPLMHLSKAESVRMAALIPGAWRALALSVTCYEGRRPGCGVCPACVLRARGFAEAAATDPAIVEATLP